MTRRWGRIVWCLLLFMSVAFAQDDDEGFLDEDDPIGPETAPEKPGAKPAAKEKPDAPKPVREKGKKPKMVPLASADGKHRMTVPEDWRLDPREQAGAVLAYDVTLPGGGRASFSVAPTENLGDARGSPALMRAWLIEKLAARDVVIGNDPMPSVFAERDQDGIAMAFIEAYRTTRGRTYVARIECRIEDAELARPDLLRGFAAFTCELDPAPAIPDDYETAEVGSLVIAAHPNAADSLSVFKRLVKDVEKDFRKFHGKAPVRDAPAVVFVHTDRTAARAILASYADGQYDSHLDLATSSLFILAVAKDDDQAAAQATDMIAGLLYVLRYGAPTPRWAHLGERAVARVEQHTRKSLPHILAPYARWGDNLTLAPLESDTAFVQGPEATYQALFWVAALRETKWKKAYRAFLEDFAEHHDADAAFARHFPEEVRGELRADATEFKNKKLKEIPYADVYGK